MGGRGMELFIYKGQPIADIRAWAKNRGELMVKYKAYRDIPNPYSGKVDRETYSGEMPETFWKALRMTDGWIYVAAKKVRPGNRGEQSRKREVSTTP